MSFTRTKAVFCASTILLAAHGILAQSDNHPVAQSLGLDAYERVLALDPHNEPAQKGEVETGVKEALSARRIGNNDIALAFLLRTSYWVPSDAELLTHIGVQEYD